MVKKNLFFVSMLSFDENYLLELFVCVWYNDNYLKFLVLYVFVN